MASKKLFRSSGCLVVAGAVLLVGSLCAVGVGAVIALVAPGATRDVVSDHRSEAKANAIANLRKIPELPATLIQELESTDRVAEETLSELSLEHRQRARHVLIEYYGRQVSGSMTTGMTAGVGVFSVLVLIVLGVPGALVGLLLLRRRKVWRCTDCGFAFDRT